MAASISPASSSNSSAGLWRRCDVGRYARVASSAPHHSGTHNLRPRPVVRLSAPADRLHAGHMPDIYDDRMLIPQTQRSISMPTRTRPFIVILALTLALLLVPL